MGLHQFSYLLMTMFLWIHPVAAAAISEPTTQELIDRVCRQTEDYGFCNQTFNRNLKCASTNLVGLTQITVELALNDATHTRSFIAHVLFPQASERGMRRMVGDCEEGYRAVMESFQKAAILFFLGEYGAMLREERSTPKAQANCNINFPAPPHPFDHLIARNKQMRVLIAMALVCAQSIVKGWKY